MLTFSDNIFNTSDDLTLIKLADENKLEQLDQQIKDLEDRIAEKQERIAVKRKVLKDLTKRKQDLPEFDVEENNSAAKNKEHREIAEEINEKRKVLLEFKVLLLKGIKLFLRRKFSNQLCKDLKFLILTIFFLCVIALY